MILANTLKFKCCRKVIQNNTIAITIMKYILTLEVLTYSNCYIFAYLSVLLLLLYRSASKQSYKF